MIELSTYVFDALRKDEEFILYRGRSKDDPCQAAFASYGAPLILGEANVSQEPRRSVSHSRVLVLSPVAEYPTPESLRRLEHASSFREELEPKWAARPIAMARHWDRTVLVLEDPGGVPLDQLLGPPLDLGFWLLLAIGLSSAIDQLHQRGIIHKDIKPANVLVDSVTGQCWLMGFGIASRLPRERQSPEPPEFIAGTLAYMAPEQTGCMNRSIDSRSDLYSLGVTLYQMITGGLPFTAVDPMEWVHCHIARQPEPPAQRAKSVPEAVSAIIMKLLAKTAEERYQTAAGVESDLQRCLAQWETRCRIGKFPLGERDTPDRLLIPEKLYGRAREIDTLLTSFDRVMTSGRPELVLVSGSSGIGKSSVVNELHKRIVLPRGIFLCGKFEQYKREVPYATFAQAFQILIRQILSKSEVEVQAWREAIREAVGPNGQLIVNLIPEVELVIGKQPPVSELPPTEAESRFHMVFRAFLGVFARKDHPLALFLDDLQWLDAATVKLLEHLITHSDDQYLLLIGAFRDNEISSSHPLIDMMEAIRQTGAVVQEIVLGPLSIDDLSQLVADTLRCERARAEPLVRFVYEKTLGNPFFAIQSLTALCAEHFLEFDAREAIWKWDLDNIRAKGFTDNVVELMLGKLRRFPSVTQQAMKLFACLGNSADAATLAIVRGGTETDVHADLWEAVQKGIVLRRGDSYRFLHDRVQEAAYALIPATQRAAVHLEIGRLLIERMTAEEIAEKIFEIVNQFNLGLALISAKEEKDHLAELNLQAGRKAKGSMAYASACMYLSTGMELAGEDAWERRYELTLGLWLERAECEYLNANFDKAERLISELLWKSKSKVDKAATYRLKMLLDIMRAEYRQAVDSGLECLRLFGIEMPAHPTREQVEVEYKKIWRNLGQRSIESLVDLPQMTDPKSQAAMRVLAELSTPAWYTDSNLFCLHVCYMTNISLMHGTTDASPHSYAELATILGPIFHRYSDGYRFGKLACSLVEKYGFIGAKAKAYLGMARVVPWTQPIVTAIDFVQLAFRAGIETHDRSYTCFSCIDLVTDQIMQGVHLDEVWSESERGLDFARKAKFRDAADFIVSQQRFIQNMRGQTAAFSSFSDERFDEETFEAQLTGDRMPTMVCYYWMFKLQARFMSGDYDAAMWAAQKAKALLWSAETNVQSVNYYYYGALTIAALHDRVEADKQTEGLEALRRSRERLGEWAASCPSTFIHKYRLVSAEVARIEGRDLDAMRLYEEAIRSARENGLVQNEGIANELAAAFYAARGFETIAHAYLRNARHCYLRWGANGKVRQLEKVYPYLGENLGAAGLENDLRRCLTESETQDSIDDFVLGEHDTPDRLLIPEKLYGRAAEVEALLAAFDRMVESGAPELVLVSGYSGIGKSSVVNELHKVLVPSRGLFASGKFDQYKRDIPYSTLVQAFQSLVRPLLGKSDAELAIWRGAFLEALDPNARLMTDLIPELKLIIGDQPPVPELEPQQAQSRFQMVFRRLIGVFARPEHPLALFLDDLQWLDAATIDLLEVLLTRSDVQHLMLIGAYRDNEVNSAHPLMGKLEAIRQAGARVQEIILAPLTCEDLGRLIADSLHCEPERVTPLARLVHEKTAGNPFFTLQFISALAEEALFTFDRGGGRWSWDLSRIQAKGYTDNVVDLMIGKLNRLPVETQKALKEFACLGNSAEITTLSFVHGLVLRSESSSALQATKRPLGPGHAIAERQRDGEGGSSEEEVHSDLWEAVRLEFIVRLEGSYKFAHDRVQEAAYSLIPEQLRAEAHLRIGRLLVAHTPPEQREEAIFEIVNQLNRGAALIASGPERERLAELNLIAGRRAKASTAYASALTYLTGGAALLPDDVWERRHELAFALERHRAECEFLTGALAEAEARLAKLADRAATPSELATVTRLRVDLFMTLGRSDRAVAVGLDCLRRFNVTWSAHPTRKEVEDEYTTLWRQLGDRPIEGLLDLPRMVDPVACSAMDVLVSLVTPALWTDENLRCLVIGRMGNLSLQHGNSEASGYAYTAVGNVLGLYFGDYKAGFRFGELGLDFVEQPGMVRWKARVYLAFGNLAKPSVRHVRTGGPLARYAFETAQQVGDLTYAGISCNNMITQLLASGAPLAEVQHEAEAGLDFARQARFGIVVDLITTQLGLIRTLRGLTPVFGCFNDEGFEEEQFEHQLAADPSVGSKPLMYWIRKLQARTLAKDHVAAVAAAEKAERLLWMSPVILERADYHFYAALALVGLCDAASDVESVRYKETLAAHHRQLQAWAEHCPENFASRAELVGAERARLQGREIDAGHLYEQATRSARSNGLFHIEAVAYERASAFYRARGFDEIAAPYLQKARHCYLSWGADGKVHQLDELYPNLRTEGAVAGPTGKIEARIDQLDLAAVVKVSQAISSEIVPAKLIETILKAALEHAGAERGLLILTQGEQHRIEAEIKTDLDHVQVQLRDAPITSSELPESLFRYVIRTQQRIILDDASANNMFSEDEYLRQRCPRSILCLPLVKQTKVVGVLYLEHNLAPRVFTQKRLAMLELLASQAAISLDHARLYSELSRANANLEHSQAYLAEAESLSKCGSWALKPATKEITHWSPERYHLFGFDPEAGVPSYDAVLQRVHPEDLTRWLEKTEQAERRDSDLDFRIVLPDGKIKHLHGVGHPVFSKSGELVEHIGAAIDITERKHAEEQRREAQAHLAHVTRVATLGELAGSIAHEVKQPLTAIINNAEACLALLPGEISKLEDVREALSDIISDADRASSVIERIRGLIKKSPPQKSRLDLNEAIGGVIALARGELDRNKVLLRTKLANDLPIIIGDRIHLQQVLLNLVINAIEAMRGVTDAPRELWISSEKLGSAPDLVDAGQETRNPQLATRSILRSLGEKGNSEHAYILVSVADSGPGLDPNILGRLFDAFYTTKPEGLGMGLSISRSLIEAHGGRLWARANVPKGALFQFTLPIGAE